MKHRHNLTFRVLAQWIDMRSLDNPRGAFLDCRCLFQRPSSLRTSLEICSCSSPFILRGWVSHLRNICVSKGTRHIKYTHEIRGQGVTGTERCGVCHTWVDICGLGTAKSGISVVRSHYLFTCECRVKGVEFAPPTGCRLHFYNVSDLYDAQYTSETHESNIV
jgi:hypothetical protein